MLQSVTVSFAVTLQQCTEWQGDHLQSVIFICND